ncbi:hypothetical protein K6L59_03480, partial [Candidatus Phytoplasma sp. Tabriz.2]|nr:hypothetical protein [Candidatus Phytoplasma australiense]
KKNLLTKFQRKPMTQKKKKNSKETIEDVLHSYLEQIQYIYIYIYIYMYKNANKIEENWHRTPKTLNVTLTFK